MNLVIEKVEDNIDQMKKEYVLKLLNVHKYHLHYKVLIIDNVLDIRLKSLRPIKCSNF